MICLSLSRSPITFSSPTVPLHCTLYISSPETARSVLARLRKVQGELTHEERSLKIKAALSYNS